MGAYAAIFYVYDNLPYTLWCDLRSNNVDGGDLLPTELLVLSEYIYKL